MAKHSRNSPAQDHRSRRTLAVLPILMLVLAGCSNGTPTPTPLPPPIPTVIVITAIGPYLATFDEPGGWLIGDSEETAGRVENGEYFLSVGTADAQRPIVDFPLESCGGLMAHFVPELFVDPGYSDEDGGADL